MRRVGAPPPPPAVPAAIPVRRVGAPPLPPAVVLHAAPQSVSAAQAAIQAVVNKAIAAGPPAGQTAIRDVAFRATAAQYGQPMAVQLAAVQAAIDQAVAGQPPHVQDAAAQAAADIVAAAIPAGSVSRPLGMIGKYGAAPAGETVYVLIDYKNEEAGFEDLYYNVMYPDAIDIGKDADAWNMALFGRRSNLLLRGLNDPATAKKARKLIIETIFERWPKTAIAVKYLNEPDPNNPERSTLEKLIGKPQDLRDLFKQSAEFKFKYNPNYAAIIDGTVY
jgi:hypothetical protein